MLKRLLASWPGRILLGLNALLLLFLVVLAIDPADNAARGDAALLELGLLFALGGLLVRVLPRGGIERKLSPEDARSLRLFRSDLMFLLGATLLLGGGIGVALAVWR